MTRECESDSTTLHINTQDRERAVYGIGRCSTNRGGYTHTARMWHSSNSGKRVSLSLHTYTYTHIIKCIFLLNRKQRNNWGIIHNAHSNGECIYSSTWFRTAVRISICRREEEMASHPSQFSRGKFCNAETDAYYIRCGRVDGARVFKNASHKVLLDGPIIADIASVDFWGEFWLGWYQHLSKV